MTDALRWRRRRRPRSATAASLRRIRAPATARSAPTPTPRRLAYRHGLAGCRPPAAAARPRGCSTCERRAQRHLRRVECSSSGIHVALQRRDRLVEMIDDRRRRPALLERRGIDERLEGGARLPSRLDVARSKWLSSKSRPPTSARTSPVVRIHRDQRRLQRVRRRRLARRLTSCRAAARARLDLGDRARHGAISAAVLHASESMVVKTRRPPW